MIKGLDLILDLYGDRHPLKEQREAVVNWRGIGLGCMGLADLALSMSVGYGTPKFLEILDKIMKLMINKSTQTSALLAKEKGVFPLYNYEYISNSRFFKEALTDETKELVKKYGLRNSRLISIAPNGSISNILGTSGGVEPFFMLGYQRTIKSMFEEEKHIWVYEKTPLKLMKHLGIDDHNLLPEWAKITSQNIKFEDRAKVQATIQKYVDTGISSTFNLPNDATTHDIENIYIKAWELGLKGITVFRDNCKKIGILTGGGEQVDKNPATKPEITIKESWYNKHNQETKEYLTTIKIEDNTYSSNKVETEFCPICGSVLVKQGGCTKCSNNECFYEKCSI